MKDKIVVGHAIHNDFQALKYFHPKDRTRDTSRIPLLNQKAGMPVRASASLKNLAKHLLHKKIQVSSGHLAVRWGSRLGSPVCALSLFPHLCGVWEMETPCAHPMCPPER